ncbi:MAG TPA: hypothetical protein PLB62_08920, partial [Candidatus Sumerlaeota bacterium]|nr:hypothetical protein [Candidatus Sumerlaeota bacterium]
MIRMDCTYRYRNHRGVSLIAVMGCALIIFVSWIQASESTLKGMIFYTPEDEGSYYITEPVDKMPLLTEPAWDLVIRVLEGSDNAGNIISGVRPAAPAGTILTGMDLNEPGAAVIRLEFPRGGLDCSNFGGPDADRLTDVIFKTLNETFGIHKLEILVREEGESDEDYRELVERLMENIPRTSKEEIEIAEAEKAGIPTAPPAPVDGQFPGSTGAWPQGFLSGKGVFLNSSHGAVYRSKTNSWGLQRGLLLELNEDIHVAEMVNWYLSQYIRNAGAQVWPVREMDFQTNMIIIDSLEGSLPANAGDCVKTGTWSTTSGKGFKLYTPPLRDENMPFRSGTGSYERAAVTKSGTPTATAVFTPNIPAEGFYHVYVCFVGNSDQARGAHVKVNHSGGTSAHRVIQSRDGNTWLWLGNYHFEAGKDPGRGAVIVQNDVEASDAGSYVAIDAVRFGGGMGDIQRWDEDLNAGKTYVGSGKERWQEEARYYLQFTGMPASQFNTTCYTTISSDGVDRRNQRDECDGWTARSLYVSYETETGEDTCYLGMHTNASTGNPDTATARGLSTFVSTAASDATKTFRNYVHDQIYSDVIAGYAPATWRNNKNTGNYGENNQTNLGSSPGFLIELLFHDNTQDCEMYRDPKFRQLAA